VIKTVRRRRLVRVRHRAVVGTLETVQQVLAACGWQINAAFIERVNLSIRQHVAAVGRRVITLCKGEDGLHQQLALYHVYYNFCLPYSQNIRTRLSTEGYASTIARDSACLPHHHHPYSGLIWMAKAERGGDGLEKARR